MHVPNGDGEFHKLIDEPRNIKHGIALIDRHGVVVSIVRRSEFRHHAVVGNNSLLHVVKTQVARHLYDAFRMEMQLKTACQLPYGQHGVKLPFPHVGCTDGLKVSIVKMKAEHGFRVQQSL